MQSSGFLDSPFKLFCFLLLATFGVLTLFSYPVPLNHDEIAYMVMARDFAEHHSFIYQNEPQMAYVNAASEAVQPYLHSSHALMRVPELHQSVFQYPPVGPLLATPLVLLTGLNGLLFLNSIAFLLSVWLVWQIALLLFAERSIAATSCLIYVLGTYTWFYGQTFFVHMPAVTLVLAASYLSMRAFLERHTNDSLRDMLYCGLLIGIAGGIRYDAWLALPVLFIPFLFTRPIAWKHMVLGLIGPALSCLIYACINYHKFNIFHPFTYGEYTQSFTRRLLPLAPLGLFALMLLRAIYYSQAQWKKKITQSRWMLTAIVFLLIAATFMLLWAIRFPLMSMRPANFLEFCMFVITGILNQAIDGRIGFSLFNQFRQGGQASTGLLQSCPCLMLLGWYLLRHPMAAQHKRALLLLVLIPLTYIMVIGSMGMFGLIHPFRRLLLPALPYLSILSAFALCHICAAKRPYVLLVPVFLLAAGLFWYYAGHLPPQKLGLAMEGFPLWIAGSIALCLLLVRNVPSVSLQWVTATAVTIAFAWTSAMSGAQLLYETKLRRGGYQQFVLVQEKVEPGSMLLSENLTSNQFYEYMVPDTIFVRLYKERPHVKQALKLIRQAQSEGRKVYLVNNGITNSYLRSATSLTLVATEGPMHLFEVK